MNRLLDINPIWITLGPIVVINVILLTSYVTYIVWGRKRITSDREGAKEHSSKLISGDTSNWWMWTTDPIVRLLIKLKIGPNTITMIGFLIAALAAILFSQGWFGYAGWTMIFGATFDMFDGRVARITGKTSRSGAFLDAVLDRFSEGACMLGLAYYFRDSWMLLVVVAGLIGSLCVSYTKARAEAMNVSCNVGTMQRPERITYLGVASIFSPIIVLILKNWWSDPPAVSVYAALILIALLTNGTAIYRMIHVMNVMDTEDERERESIPQIITKLSTPEGREAFWDKTRYGYDRSKSSYDRVVLMVAGGMKPDIVKGMIADGKLPNISEHIVDRGGVYNCTGSFPSTDGPSATPFVTGCFPGVCDLPGVKWFDRRIPANKVISMNRFRDYNGWGAYAMDHDLSKSVRTIFEYSKQAVNIFGMLNRGCGLVRDPAFFRMRGGYERQGISGGINQALEAGFYWFSAAIRRETDFVLYRLPSLSSVSIDDDGDVEMEYLRLDESVGRVAEMLKEKKMYDGSAIMLSSDYSLGLEKSSMDLSALLTSGYRVSSSGRRARERDDSDIISLTSGTSMAHLYVKAGDDWGDGRFFEDMESDGLIDLLNSSDGIDIIAGRSRRGGVIVAGNNSRAHLIEDGDGRITYIAEAGDPFGLSSVAEVMDSSDALRTTLGSKYPDGIMQVLQLFRSKRTGDLVLSADEGVSFAFGDGTTHGSLHADHISVPLMSSVPISSEIMRTSDAFALILDVLGIEITHAMDGRTPL